MGYTPLFDTMLEGTLYGRWPHTGIWACLLSLVDQHGCINKNPQLIATAVGVPLDVFLSCIADFMSPDAASQSQENEGRRLELIDPRRNWGWRVVNAKKYREKARLMGKSKREVEEGKNAARLKDRRRPPKTAAKRPSDSYSDIDLRKDKEAPLQGLNFEAWNRWVNYRSETGKPIKKVSAAAAQRKLAKFGEMQDAVVENSIAENYQGLFAPKSNGHAGRVTEWE
jgi:hypothetical protein